MQNGCGGLRDCHNMIWTSFVKLGIRDLSQLVRRRICSEIAGQEILKAHDFLLRVRNDMHYAEKRATDILTLRLQGTVATNLDYTGRRIIQRAHGYVATICKGEVTYENGVHTGALPGRLIRGGATV